MNEKALYKDLLREWEIWGVALSVGNQKWIPGEVNNC